MKPSRRSLARCVAVTGAFALVAGTFTAILAGSDSPLRIVAVTVQDEVVRVELQNMSAETHSAVVHTKIALDGGVTEVSAAVTIHGGQKAFVLHKMASPVRGVIECGGIVDDGSPF